MPTIFDWIRVVFCWVRGHRWMPEEDIDDSWTCERCGFYDYD